MYNLITGMMIGESTKNKLINLDEPNALFNEHSFSRQKIQGRKNPKIRLLERTLSLPKTSRKPIINR